MMKQTKLMDLGCYKLETKDILSEMNEIRKRKGEW